MENEQFAARFADIMNHPTKISQNEGQTTLLNNYSFFPDDIEKLGMDFSELMELITMAMKNDKPLKRAAKLYTILELTITKASVERCKVIVESLEKKLEVHLFSIKISF